MTSPAPKLRSVASAKRTADADPNFIRSLVASTPLQEAPVTAVVEESSVDAALHDTRPGAWNAHLAQLLHSMYLVTFTEKAQLGAMYSRNGDGGGTAGLPPHAAAPDDAAHAPTCSHSVTVDSRWLGAVTRYGHFTATFDDVARVAMVFPELLTVRWSIEETKRRGASGAYLEDAAAVSATYNAATSMTDPLAVDGDGNAIQRVPSGGKLVARVYLAQSRVISLEEAVEHLKESLRKKGSASAQRAWRASVNHHTAYSAYVDGLASASTLSLPSSSLSPVDTAVGTEGGASSPPRSESKDAVDVRAEDNKTLTDEELCATISGELRASLSAPKLQALLRQMRKDAAHIEEAEQHRIAQRQLRERLLNAYEHVRALYGPKDTRGRSALALITAMQQESRFEDTLDIQALLSALLAVPAAGLSATMLCEGRVVAEQASPAPTKGVITRGKRKRAEKGGEARRNGGDAPTVVVHVTEPSFEQVTTLNGLTDEQLDLVLVRLDRSSSSVKGVLEATS